jgi:hypothetical protein
MNSTSFIPPAYTGQLNLDQCTEKRRGLFQGHCFHAIERPSIDGGTIAHEMVCCHCGRTATLSAGMVTPIFHGPHAPKHPRTTCD